MSTLPDVTPPRPMSMLRREADVREIGSATFRDTQPALGRVTCERCDWFTYRPGQLAEHTAIAHPAMCPAVRRFVQAAEAGEGLHRGTPRKKAS